ncbi:aldehyde dehydrogenase [Burkholderia multivorans]|uniref:aldehyde dehydrogenase n=1 Tax=Burkholderia multivorans TaxID=87883 RepID=UPI002018A123|nr:aldehyde dehydrogenase [Burkholderia multivorans]MCO1368615.1 aldehyde dehydrogenase [Burkholderia multivorans]MCO1380506.1 aldehyde dehydrogenase [Burkholderia multivorans]MDN8032431.1 aldehyde dehydrogenase [Burkholderia multivorans]UQP22063.1 aldehyde dehydrogenase [Burkholderia multivorans]UQP91488.1 aldehyde dehydrogenase [Burkholderia multivorans]
MITHQDWKQKADALSLDGRAFIAGQRSAAASGETFATLNPASGKVLAEVARCNQRDVDRAVAAARDAFEAGIWSKAAPAHRKAVLLRVAQLIDEHAEELALLEALEAGKPIGECLGLDIPESAACIRWHAEVTDKRYDALSPSGAGVVSMITREPIGVVGAVLPWNFPALMLAWKIGPALSVGNSVVVKPAEQTSLSTLRIADLALEAGVPPGVFSVVTGFGGEAGEAIGRHPDVDLVAFTGSTATGKRFLHYSADTNLKRVVLECGGKNPQVILPDVTNLDAVAEQAVAAAFWNMGENCSAGSRILVPSSRKAELLEKVQTVLAGWKTGDPLDPDVKLGALIEQKHYEKVLGHIEKAKAEGAHVVCGGRAILRETGGWFVEPTIFDQVTPEMSIARDEVFGPVVCFIEYDDVDHAVRIANDTCYGLAASLWTDNVNSAHKVAARIRAGTVTVNCFGEGDLSTPFGGFKQSGFGGRDKSVYAHDQYCELKTTWLKLD